MSRSAEQRVRQAQLTQDKFRDDVNQQELEAGRQEGVRDPVGVCVCGVAVVATVLQTEGLTSACLLLLVL